MSDHLPGLALKEIMGGIVGHIVYFPTLFKPEPLFYNSDSFHLAYRIKLTFKLRNMEKTWGKMVVPKM